MSVEIKKMYWSQTGRDDDPKRVRYVRLEVLYQENRAEIELPVGGLQHDQEPLGSVYRRQLAELTQALQEFLESPQSIA
jgi:hypothetical protein